MPSFDTLHNLHLFAAIAHAVQSGYAFGLTNTTFKEKGNFEVTNPFRRPEGNNEHVIGSFKLGNVVAVFPALSTMNHLWAYFDRERYESYVDKGYNPVRWAEYSLSAGIMFIVVSILSGNPDVKALTSLGIGNAALQYIGYMVEKQVGTYPKTIKTYETTDQMEKLGFLVFFALWAPIMTAFFTGMHDSQNDEDQDGVTPVVWSIIFILFALMMSFGVVSVLYQRKNYPGETKYKIEDFKTVEYAFIWLSLLSKSFLTNMTLFGALGAEPEEKK